MSMPWVEKNNLLKKWIRKYREKIPWAFHILCTQEGGIDFENRVAITSDMGYLAYNILDKESISISQG